MLNALAAERKPESAVLAGLTDAAKAATAAGADTPDLSIAPSCTYSAVAVVPAVEGRTEIAVGNVGDSRTYWLPEPPAHARCLTVDDSVAQELISAGAAAESDAVQAGAHTITRWLGADADTDAVVGLQRAGRSPSTGPVCCWCVPTACGTTCPRPTTSRGSAADTAQPKRRAHWSTTR